MLRKFSVTVNGKEYIVEMEEIGASGPVAVAPVAAPAAAPQPVPVAASAPAPVAAPVAVATPAAVPVAPPAAAVPVALPSGEGETITAPMPGTILKIMVKVGDTVAFEQALVILEAMKMENEIVAPKEGTVTAIHVTEGSAVDVSEAIITIA